MIVVPFKAKCRPGKAEQLERAFAEVVAASQPLEGVVSFDIGRDITDGDSFIATEVFSDREALDRQELLPEVQRTLALLGEALGEAPEATIFHVSSSGPHGG